MSTGDPSYGCVTTTNTANTNSGTYWTLDDRYLEYTTPYYPAPLYQEPVQMLTPFIMENKKERSDEDMRYLYYVILVNPKTDEFFTTKVVAKSETSALMAAYGDSNFSNVEKISEGIVAISVPFDDLKYNCKQLMEWKKEKSLEKALETIKKAVE
jgi:hypothetical protein